MPATDSTAAVENAAVPVTPISIPLPSDRTEVATMPSSRASGLFCRRTRAAFASARECLAPVSTVTLTPWGDASA
jgi:hypothetical protein